MERISYTLEQAAKQVGCSARALHYAVSNGEIHPRYAGDEALIRHEDLAAWVGQLPMKPNTGTSAVKEHPKPRTPQPAKAPQPSISEPESEWLTPEDLGRSWRLSPGTLANWRTNKNGPAFVRIGGAVRYRRDIVEAWLKAQPSE